MKWVLKSETGRAEDIRALVNRSISRKNVECILSNGVSIGGNWVYTIWYWSLEG